ncbi:MAG: TSUP family transporter [Desulfotomaculales bacterium]
MEYLAVSVAAFMVALLTLFSGFGLGTLLLPVLAVFFPVEVAVAATAVVHLANNVFKAALVGRHADRQVVKAFGLPAAVTAVAGAGLLAYLSELQPLVRYAMAGREYTVSAAKMVVAALIILFALFELLPSLQKLSFDRRYLPLGGVLSGFFGGLSGHQGALRSAFLIRVRLEKEAFVGTGSVIALMVDVARLVVYGVSFFGPHLAAAGAGDGPRMVGSAVAAAFLGSLAGARLLKNKKITVRSVQYLVAAMLMLLGVALGVGVV